MHLAMFLFRRLFAIHIPLIFVKNMCSTIKLQGKCTIFRFDLYDGIKIIEIKKPITVNENNILVDEDNIFSYEGIQKIFIKKDYIFSSQLLLNNKPVGRDIFQQMLFAEKLNASLLGTYDLFDIFTFNTSMEDFNLHEHFIELRNTFRKFKWDLIFVQKSKSFFYDYIKKFLMYVLINVYGMTKDSKLVKEVFKLTNENFYDLSEEIIQIINFEAWDDFIIGSKNYQILREIVKKS